MISHYNFKFQTTHIHCLGKFCENDVNNINMIRMNRIGGLHWKGKIKSQEENSATKKQGFVSLSRKCVWLSFSFYVYVLLSFITVLRVGVESGVERKCSLI